MLSQPVQQKHAQTQATTCCQVSSDIVNDHTTQSRMKSKLRYDRRASQRNFALNDKVLVLLLIPGQPLQARFHGPCVVQKHSGTEDYVIRLIP